MYILHYCQWHPFIKAWGLNQPQVMTFQELTCALRLLLAFILSFVKHLHWWIPSHWELAALSSSIPPRQQLQTRWQPPGSVKSRDYPANGDFIKHLGQISSKQFDIVTRSLCLTVLQSCLFIGCCKLERCIWILCICQGSFCFFKDLLCSQCLSLWLVGGPTSTTHMSWLCCLIQSITSGF